MRPITKDIKISDLRTMKASGMTQKQIAECLGICQATVGRYIGNAGKKRARIVNDNPITPEFPILEKIPDIKTEGDKISVVFEVLTHVSSFKGVSATYTVDMLAKSVCISEQPESYTAEQLDQLIEELKVVRSKLA